MKPTAIDLRSHTLKTAPIAATAFGPGVITKIPQKTANTIHPSNDISKPVVR
jgi:hypothetical protein